jgi:hypothetical protein
MRQMHPGPTGLEQISGPIPAVGGLQDHLGIGPGLGQLQRQRHWVVVDADDL